MGILQIKATADLHISSQFSVLLVIDNLKNDLKFEWVFNSLLFRLSIRNEEVEIEKWWTRVADKNLWAKLIERFRNDWSNSQLLP